VHLTLNCEYEGYRWGPVSRDAPSLSARDGGMWLTTRETVENATADDVERELRAQVDKALAAGIDVTHIDAHMGTAFNLKFVDAYFRIARDYRLPAFVPRVRARDLPANNLPNAIQEYAARIDQAEAEGFPIFDHFDADSLEFEPGMGLAHNTRRLERLGPGLSYLITHCAEGGRELESITRDWRQRDEEHRIYSDGSMGQAFQARGVRRLGMRPLRDVFRAERASLE
jgi:predicted glycoside hydrolase/deacetylase ChbG (UPF0249 family)